MNWPASISCIIPSWHSFEAVSTFEMPNAVKARVVLRPTEIKGSDCLAKIEVHIATVVLLVTMICVVSWGMLQSTLDLGTILMRGTCKTSSPDGASRPT